jgi:acyl transferase domain-containing protein
MEEVKGLGLCLKARTKQEPVALTAVKSNLGHTVHAAGISGLIKVLLGFKNNVLYPIANFEKPKATIDFETAKLEPMGSLKKIPRSQKRIAGVSSYGLNGLNLHLVVESYDNELSTSEKLGRENHILKLSAKTESSLKAYALAIKGLLESTKQNINDIVYTLNVGRDDFAYRCAACFDSVDELCRILADPPFKKTNKTPVLVLDLRGVGNLTAVADLPQMFDVSEGEERNASLMLLAFLYDIGIVADCLVINKQSDDAQYRETIPEVAMNIVALEEDKPFITDGEYEVLTFSDEWNQTFEGLLTKVAALYMAGYSIAWDKYYKKSGFHKVSTVPYQFDKITVWPFEITDP